MGPFIVTGPKGVGTDGRHHDHDPDNGKSPHGFFFMQSEDRLLNASGKMWTRPVDKMTPAAKALIRKTKGLSGPNAGTDLTIIGRQTPIAPETRIVAMAANFKCRAEELLSAATSEAHSQAVAAAGGSTAAASRRPGERRRKKSLSFISEA